MDSQSSMIVGIARLGRVGGKLHPAVKDPLTGWVQPICGCPGTRGNRIQVTGFWEKGEATCQSRSTRKDPI